MPTNGVPPPEFGKLTGLSKFALSGNRLPSLPPEIGDLTSFMDLDLRDNTVPVPPEVLKAVNHPPEHHRILAETLIGGLKTFARLQRGRREWAGSPGKSHGALCLNEAPPYRISA